MKFATSDPIRASPSVAACFWTTLAHPGDDTNKCTIILYSGRSLHHSTIENASIFCVQCLPWNGETFVLYLRGTQYIFSGSGEELRRVSSACLVLDEGFHLKTVPWILRYLQKRLEVFLSSESGRLHDEVYTIYGHCWCCFLPLVLSLHTHLR